MPDPHIPFHARASAAPDFPQIGLAIDPPGPLPIADRKPRLQPKPPSDPIRDFATFMAGVSILAERFNAAVAPVVVAFARYGAEYRAAFERLSVRLPRGR